MTIAEHLNRWAARAAQHTDATSDQADALIAAADAAEMAAIRARQAANRHAAYERRRPSRYAAAAYGLLTPEQNPRNMITTWWERGPRALVIAGPARTGKTTAAYAIANHVHTTQHWVIVWPAADLAAALKPDGDPAAYDHAVGCDLLVIDDLGRERATDWWLEQLQRLVDARCAHQRRLVATTNTTPDQSAAYEELVIRYGDPIVERLLDDGGVIVVDGPPRRRTVTEW